MNILILDRDDMGAQLLQSKLEALGHHVVYEQSRKDAVVRIQQDVFDVIFVDPAPMKSAQSAVLDFRRYGAGYSYIFLVGQGVTSDMALSEGVNDVLVKPLQVEDLDQKVRNAQRFCQLVRHMRDDSEDFPSAGGVIAKSAFVQLFLSGIDRAGRYGERSAILSVSVANYREILALDGVSGVDYVVARLSQYLAQNRRQSDIIGQSAQNAFSLLLWRPAGEAEPVDAANRLAQGLSESTFFGGQALGPAEISFELVDIPSGELLVSHEVNLARGS